MFFLMMHGAINIPLLRSEGAERMWAERDKPSAGVLVSEPGADRGPHAGSPRGVVDATGS